MERQVITVKTDIRRHARLRLRTVLIVIALIAAACPIAVPWAKRTYFPKTWNRWIVRTETKSDGSTVRVRVRRLPDRDIITEEVLIPAPKSVNDLVSPRKRDDHDKSRFHQ